MIYINLKGGLGNQLFQYATARCIQEKSNDKIIIVTQDLNQNNHDNYALDHFNIVDVKLIPKKNKFIFNGVCALDSIFFRKLKHGSYYLNKLINIASKLGIYITLFDNSDFTFNTKNKNLNGYFQSTKYFDDIREILLTELSVKDEMMASNNELYDNILKSNSVCLHIRRGDYVGNITHEVCNIDYYKKAIKLMNEKVLNPKFFVFSDDIEWVKNNFKIDNAVYVEGNNPNYEELRLMYSCKNFIISNSSFSWWAQYLSKNDKKIVIAPSRWYKNNDQYDLKEKKWLLIDV